MSKDGWYRHAHKPSTKAHWTEFTESQAFEGYGYLSLCGKLYGHGTDKITPSTWSCCGICETVRTQQLMDAMCRQAREPPEHPER